MKLVDRVKTTLKERREKILNGGINCIPSPFKRFSMDFIGVEQRRYYIISSFTKVGKSMLSSYLFLYNSLIYAYEHPEQIGIKIFYYPLEETKEDVVKRFMSFLLFTKTKGNIMVSPSDLSSDMNVAIDANILKTLDEEPYKSLLDFFEEHVIFSDSRNPSGMWFECQGYAKEHGKIYKTKTTFNDELGVAREKEVFDHYEPDDPNEYRIIFVDHCGKWQNERNMDERQTICKSSEYAMLLRDRYNFTPVFIQQQNMQGEGLEAFKLNKLRPSLAGAGTAKTISQDCDMFIGLFSPYRSELTEYKGYDITKFKDNIRFMEIVINRRGQSNGIVALLFVGQCNYWQELPLPNDTVELEKVYRFLMHIRGVTKVSMFIYSIKNLFKKVLRK